MDILLAIVIGTLFASSFYMMLRRSMVKMIVGLILLGHAANLLIFVNGTLTRGKPPLIEKGADVLLAPYSDPVTQALILTAIVISFGLQAFVLVLFKRAYSSIKTDDLDKMRSTDTNIDKPEKRNKTS